MKSLLTIFILFLSVSSIYSVEDACYSNLISKIDSYYMKGLNTTFAFCSTYINFYFACDTEGYITSIRLDDQNLVRNKVSWSDISCFSRLSSLYFESVDITPDFLYTIDRPINTLKFGNGINVNTINATIPVAINSLIFGELTGRAKASYLKNVRTFDAGFEKEFTLEIDGDQSNSALKTFTYATKNVPDLTPFLVSSALFCNIKFHVPINESTLVNLDSFLTRCNSVTFSATSDFYFNFPQSFTNISKPTYTSLTFGNYMKVRTNSYIDFSSYNNERNVYSFFFSMAYAGNVFNGLYPFSGFPNSFQDLYADIFDCQVDLVPNLNIFKRIGKTKSRIGIRYSKMGGSLPPNNEIFTGLDRFQVNMNRLNGTLDKSWCNGVELDVSDNQMSGDLPLCYFCYLDLDSVKNRFRLNNFSNFYNTNRSQCNYETIIPNVKLTTNFSMTPNPQFTYFEIFGENLGYESSNIQFTPSSQFINYISYGNRFSTSIYNSPITGLTKKVNMTIKSLGLTYTLSISLTPPIINQMIQNNDTLTFIGEYFTYNSSDTTITIDNYQLCHIVKTSFYRIDCVLDKQLRAKGLRPTNFTVKGLTTIASFDYQYIKYPCYCLGKCNSVNGTCYCDPGYTSYPGYPVCSVPQHYVSGVVPVPSSLGGNLTLLGWFGSPNDQLSVMVGESHCNITSIHSKVIICQIEAGQGIKTIQVNQNNLKYTNKFTPYYELPGEEELYDNSSEEESIDYPSDVHVSLNFPMSSILK